MYLAAEWDTTELLWQLLHMVIRNDQPADIFFFI